MQPERFLACDDEAIAPALARLLRDFFDAGGWLAPGARIRCADGALSLERGQEGAGDLVRLPKAGLLPVRQAGIRLEGDALVPGAVPPDWAPARAALLEGMLEVYNLTGKIAFEREVGVAFGLARDPELAPLLEPMTACRGHLEEMLRRAREGDPVLAQESFFGSRVLGFDDPASPVYGKEQVVMPVIDFMNHHFSGAGFETRHDEEHGVHLAVRQWSPQGGRGECFVRYGNYDALDTLLSYGFVDHSAPFVRSLPVTLDLPGAGRVQVLSTTFIHKGELPPQLGGLRTHLPAIRRSDDSHQLSHLLIPTGRASGALRTVLRHVVRQIAPRLRPLQVMQAVKAAEAQLLEHNRRYYEGLRTWIEANRPGSRWPELPARLLELAGVQLEKLAAYRPPG